MDITLDKISTVDTSIKVKLSEEDYQLKVEKKVKEYARKVDVKGFRPGKVPIGLIQKKYGKSILIEEINHIVSHAVNDYIKENDLKIIGQPLPNTSNSNKIDWDTQKQFEFDFDIGLIDPFKVELSVKQKIKGYTIEANGKVINEALDKLRKQFGPVTNPEISKSGDRLFGTLSEDKGDLTKDTLISIDEVDKKFQKNFIDVKKSEVISFDIEKAIKNIPTFTTLLGKDQLQNLKGRFSFTVKNVNRTVPADLNQDLFDKVFGPNAVKSEEEFLNRISETIRANYNRQTNLFLENSIKDHLIEKTKIEIPNDFLKKWLLASSEGKITEEVLKKEYNMYVTSLKWDLIKNTIATDNAVKVENEEVLAKSKAIIVEQFGGQGMEEQFASKLDEFANNYLKAENGENYRNVFSQVHDWKVMEVIKKKISIANKVVSIDEFQKIIAN